jgi:dTDP-4-dehydrorhamnose reductase
MRFTIRLLKPDIIVNAAAYNLVDKAESDSDIANLVNHEAVKVLAEEAVLLGAWLVHYSTDYVFGESGLSPWCETDKAAPLNRYGMSKLAGEQAIQASGYSSRGKNFARTMLKLGGECETLNVIADQIGAPTGADLIADVTALALRQLLRDPELSGLYHLTAGGEVSWYEYACHVIDFAKANGCEMRVKAVNPIEAHAYPAPARRPLNSRLSTRKLRCNFSLHLPDWQSGVTRMLREILNK